MGADIKSLRTRIKSVRSTLHLTKAMGLVASSKIRKAQLARQKSLEYAQGVASIIEVLASSRECEKSPYMQMGTGERDLIIIISGDRGLAGGYNANIFRFARELNAELLPIGKKACERCSKSHNSSERFSYDDAYRLALDLCERFKSGKYSRIGVLSTRYISMISQEPRLDWLLPLEKKSKSTASAIFEPDELTMLERSVPTYLAGVIYSLIKESFACEVVARRNAMDSASKNATTMIDELQLKYNRARQGTITQEITEIVAGSGE